MTFLQFTVVLLMAKVLYLPDMVTGIALAVAIAAHFSESEDIKTSFQNGVNAELDEIDKKFTEIDDKLDKLEKTQGMVAKQAEDTKKLLSSNNLAQAFVPRNKREKAE